MHGVSQAWPLLSRDHLLTRYHLLTICFCRLESATFVPILFYLFLYYLCGLLIWILNELKLQRQRMVFEFVVSKLVFETGVSRLRQILAQTPWENLSHISRHLESQFKNFRATVSVLHVCRIANISVLKGATMWRKFKLRPRRSPMLVICTWWRSSDRSSEFEFGILPAQPTCDIPWHFVKRWYRFLKRQRLFRFPPNKNQGSCIR